MSKFFTLFMVMVFFCLVTFHQNAAASNDAVISGINYRPMPAGAVMEVQVLDNSNENLEVLSVVSDSLRARGYPVSETGILILTLETRDEIGAWSTSGDGKTIEFRILQGSGGTGDSELRLNLFDSTSGGLLSNSQSNPTTIVTPSHYVINATLESREDGKRLWEGSVASDLGQSNSNDLLRRMAPLIAQIVGQSVDRQMVPLP